MNFVTTSAVAVLIAACGFAGLTHAAEDGMTKVQRAKPALQRPRDEARPAARDDKSRPVPQETSPFDNFDVKSTDSGDRVQDRLKFGLDKDKSLFLYGNKTTHYPTGRKPGEDYQPNLPLSEPKDSFGIGIGFGKHF